MKLPAKPARRPLASAPIEHHPVGGAAPAASRSPTHSRAVGYLLAALRISLGWVFLWAFLGKTFGLGHDTAGKQAWIHGGSPTYGSLHFSAVGPFAGVCKEIAGQGWADWLFMLGLVGIGVCLILGVAMRASAIAAATMLVLMRSVVLPPADSPFMDDHIIYAIAVLILPVLHAGRSLGLGSWWERQAIIRHHRSLG